MKAHSVIIVDDHTLFSRSLESLVNSFKDFSVVQTFNNGAELVDQLSSGMDDPDLLLLDIKMPIMDGIATMKWLKKYRPFLKVLALTMEDHEDIILSMLSNGARGYLLKDIEPQQLEFACKTVIEQGFYHTEAVTMTLMKSLNPHEKKDNEVELKDKEIQFIKLVCEEKTYREIADEMNLSPKTIDGYRQQLFDKLHIKNRIGLVIFAVKNGLIDV